MSDLTASQCGCNNGTSSISDNGGFGSWIWILLILCCCGGCGNNNGFNLANTFGGNDGNSCCSWIWILLLLSCCCGNNGGCGCNN